MWRVRRVGGVSGGETCPVFFAVLSYLMCFILVARARNASLHSLRCHGSYLYVFDVFVK